MRVVKRPQLMPMVVGLKESTRRSVDSQIRPHDLLERSIKADFHSHDLDKPFRYHRYQASSPKTFVGAMIVDELHHSLVSKILE